MRHLKRVMETPVTKSNSAPLKRREKRFAVYNRSNPDFLNVVKLYDEGSIKCLCPIFKSSRNVCSHSVAVADWVRKSQRD